MAETAALLRATTRNFYSCFLQYTASLLPVDIHVVLDDLDVNTTRQLRHLRDTLIGHVAMDTGSSTIDFFKVNSGTRSL